MILSVKMEASNDTRSRDDQNGKVDPQQDFDEKDSKKERILYVGGSSYFFVCILID